MKGKLPQHTYIHHFNNLLPPQQIALKLYKDELVANHPLSHSPFTMTIQSMKIVDGTSNVTSYAYSDQSGDYSSITTEPGNSKAYNILNQKSTTEKAKQKWDGLSTGAKIGIACGVIGAVAIGILAWCTFCIFQRRKGKKERLAADAEWDKEQAELQEYQVSRTLVPHQGPSLFFFLLSSSKRGKRRA